MSTPPVIPPRKPKELPPRIAMTDAMLNTFKADLEVCTINLLHTTDDENLKDTLITTIKNLTNIIEKYEKKSNIG